MFEGTSVKISFYSLKFDATFLTKTGRNTKLFENTAIFSRLVMVPRQFAAARVIKSLTCADVIQHYPEGVGVKWTK